MKRAYWTTDWIEAQIIEELLDSRGLPAWVFDLNTARQDWFKTLAFGGYRVMVPDSAFDDATAIIADHRSGRLAPEVAPDDVPPCPACASRDAIDDPQPRRVAFVLLFVLGFGVDALLIASPLQPRLVNALVLGVTVIQALLTVPGVMGHIVNNRHACRSCGHRWRAPRAQSFAEATRAVERASKSADAVP